MIIAIASGENHLKSIVNPSFGRCDWYLIYDTETRKSSFIENHLRHNQEKAGCNAAGFLIGKGISMAIAGRFGAKVLEMFRKNDIQMVIPETQKTLKEIINLIR
jgi:predicted Fe-Mo cluster-binding NifX family protein